MFVLYIAWCSHFSKPVLGGRIFCCRAAKAWVWAWITTKIGFTKSSVIRFAIELTHKHWWVAPHTRCICLISSCISRAINTLISADINELVTFAAARRDGCFHDVMTSSRWPSLEIHKLLSSAWSELELTLRWPVIDGNSTSRQEKFHSRENRRTEVYRWICLLPSSVRLFQASSFVLGSRPHQAPKQNHSKHSACRLIHYEFGKFHSRDAQTARCRDMTAVFSDIGSRYNQAGMRT